MIESHSPNWSGMYLLPAGIVKVEGSDQLSILLQKDSRFSHLAQTMMMGCTQAHCRLTFVQPAARRVAVFLWWINGILVVERAEHVIAKTEGYIGSI